MKRAINNISIVIPVFNEEKNIINLLEELQSSLNNKIKYEILLVDDGSTDNTISNVKSKIDLYNNLKLIVHEKNYGQSTGLLTGIKSAKYDYIVTLDGDGQNDPADILKLVKSYNCSIPFFLVIGNRKKRLDKFSRRIASPEFSTALSIKSAIFKALEACSPSTSGFSLP